jgi:hypothetical protein
MEQRVLIALILLALIGIAASWLAIRTLSGRRQFKIRQSGRGKSNRQMPTEPAE